ncbi:hypothetical protein ZHAS_00017166 [Anopheles sinensis]|uniref:Uncharacterized protein n=1 Tax=Anopheles sinensis TaxID=74873 RepID=A0A084WFA8_ANOSI|nr:hypothetical protein ZHAS_00017166 [Anopheles sinensis]
MKQLKRKTHERFTCWPAKARVTDRWPSMKPKLDIDDVAQTYRDESACFFPVAVAVDVKLTPTVRPRRNVLTLSRSPSGLLSHVETLSQPPFLPALPQMDAA